MGHCATIYGCIDGGMWITTDWQRLHVLNEQVIADLPDSDTYPPLCQGMFAITRGKGTRWQTQSIHFAWSAKNLDDNFLEWRQKFESLLKRLYFWKARLHIEQEIDGDATLIWTPTTEAIEGLYRDPPLPISTWTLAANGSFPTSCPPLPEAT